MRIWRGCKLHRIHDLSGEGAKAKGGRWNPIGTAVLYTSENNSLSMLEALVHFDNGNAPDNYRLVEMECPDGLGIEVVQIADLPATWRTYPGPDELKEIGRAWATEMRTPILSVPSAVNPHARNFIFNPVHPDYVQLRVLQALTLEFDVRLF